MTCAGMLACDDDSIINAVLLQCTYKGLEFNTYANGEVYIWPKTAAGRKKTDNGKLPLEHPSMVFLDKNQSVRMYARKCFEFSREPLKESECIHVVAERIKSSFSCCVRMYSDEEFDFLRLQRKPSLKIISTITSFVATVENQRFT